MKYTGTFMVSSLFSSNCHKSKPSWLDICSISFKLEGANLFMGKTGRHLEGIMVGYPSGGIIYGRIPRSWSG